MGTAIVDRRFEGERIELGGRRFERCRFVRCELVFDGRPAHLVDNTLEDCSWAFEGAAGVTLGFVAALCRDDPELRMTMARELGLMTEVRHPPRPPRRPRPPHGGPTSRSLR